MLETSVVLFSLFVVSFIINCGYYLIYYRRVAVHKTTPITNTKKPGVSVIICARNEVENIRNFLPFWMDQQYKEFEVVVVNDCSYDESKDVLEAFAKKYPKLKVVNIEEHERYKHGKKFALTLGIKAAKNEILLFSDADCKPASPTWIDQMQSAYQPETEIVLGFSPYFKKSGFLNFFIRFETFMVGLNYLSFAINKQAYMGVGRNLSYKKSLFFANKGFASHMHLPSGDDDLFINQTATPTNTQIQIHPDAHVFSEPKTTFSDWINQKCRHISVGKIYKAVHKRLIGLCVLSGILFYATFAALISINFSIELIVAFFAIRLIVQYIIIYKASNKLSSADLWPYVLFLDIIYHFYLIILFLIKPAPTKVKWR